VRADDVSWDGLVPADLDDLTALAVRCLATDGGLPLTAEADFVRRRWTVEGSTTRLGRDGGGILVAAARVRVSAGVATVATLVDPAARAHGAPAELLDWALGEAARRARSAIVETESLTAEQAALLTERGLRQVFAEDVLRIDLTEPVAPRSWPAGAILHPWTAETASRFFAVYEAAFRDRPGFPGQSAATWIGGLVDDGFRPEASLLVELPGRGDVGFVTAAEAWIDQVGVIPAVRGRGLGAALTAESLDRLRADGAMEAWLNVNVDNPAKTVYLRLGFVVAGRRARFAA
jgi:mycothiol synthase